jgi:hypothetical protein
MLASLTPYADIGPEPDHLPPVAAAGVRLLQTDDIAQLYLHDYILLFAGKYWNDQRLAVERSKGAFSFFSAGSESG